ncbi:hypothetical protein BP6252_07427 [Coleophoma cylindrospora]|uniref:Ilp is an apoptosis inhibitor n=1 Tax=Coleophoma cylindrospora TaxID=1849047 RepID=A0A3D8RHS0_9HELO|nr:hypothetical protein BP6252_07427 [Coleophoma cylindrospora]
MAFNAQAGPSSQPGPAYPPPSFHQSYATPSNPSHRQKSSGPSFDILEWYPQYQSCHRYFLDHAQHNPPVQALSAFMNILLPYQKHPPVVSASNASPSNTGPTPSLTGGMRHTPPNPFSPTSSSGSGPHAQSVSLIPYIRRLIATGHDKPSVLHGFFGDAWREGVGSLHEIERRNFMFAAKSTSWLNVKAEYDMGPDETCPFVSPLRNVTEEEMQAADSAWSEWLAMQDWMLGPRAPGETFDTGMSDGPRIKREP